MRALGIPHRCACAAALLLTLTVAGQGGGCKSSSQGWGRVHVVESRLGPTSWSVTVADQGQGVELFVDGSPRRGRCRRGGVGIRCWVGGLSRGFHRLEVTVSGRGSSRRTAYTSKRAVADEVVYEVLLDRFADGKLANNVRVNRADPKAAHGGDLRGLRRRLAHLKSLGVTTLLLSPIWAPSRAKPAAGRLPAYVGTATVDSLRLSPALGRPRDLMRLLSAARRRGLRVVLDLPRSSGSVSEYFTVARTWLRRTFADGVRLGPFRKGEEAAWAEHTRDLAEAFLPLMLIHHGTGDRARLRKALRSAPTGARLFEDAGPGRGLLAWLGCPGAGVGTDAQGASVKVLTGTREPGTVRVLSSHSHPVLSRRCGGGGDGARRVALALTLHLLLAEIPRVYYADEIEDPQGLNVHPDIDWTDIAGDPQRLRIRKLLGVRRGVSALRRGNQRVRQQGDVLLISRGHGRCQTLVLANRSGSAKRLDVELTTLGLSPQGGERELVDRLEGRGYTVRNNRLKLELGAGAVKVLVPAGVGACRG